MNSPEKPIIVLPGVEGNQPMVLSTTQELMIEHIDALIIFCWAMWLLTALYLISTYILVPLYEKHFRTYKNSTKADPRSM